MALAKAPDSQTLQDLAQRVMTPVERPLHHKLLAEESAGEPASPSGQGNGWMWVVDPLDGTHNFSRGIPYFAFNIALCYEREPLLGLTYAPATGEEFFAEAGKGLTVNGQPVPV